MLTFTPNRVQCLHQLNNEVDMFPDKKKLPIRKGGLIVGYVELFHIGDGKYVSVPGASKVTKA